MISEGVTNAIGGMLVQLQVAPQIENHSLQVTLRSAPPTAEGNAIFFFDIFDAFSINSEFNESGILKAMDDAHANIEHIFEKLIQENLREMFKEIKENG